MSLLKTLLVTTITILVLDSLYMTLNKSLFQHTVIHIQKTVIQPKLIGFILCYMVMILGLWYFILRRHRPVEEAFMLGIFVYGVFEFTNYAIFKKWPLEVVMMDTLWGGALYAATTMAVYNM
jgi:uncharacterized membrane protein